MSDIDIIVLAIAPVVICGSLSFIISSIRNRMNHERNELIKTQEQMTFTSLMMYNRRHGLSSQELIIPDNALTTPASNCHAHMFRDCTSLTTAPELPATTANPNCYQDMFKHCTPESSQNQRHQTWEERRAEFERKNKEDWDSYHDPSRYMR